MRSRVTLKNGLFFVAIGVYASLSVMSFLGREVNAFDECLQLLGGRAVLEGKVPHKDFWTLYPPLNYYLNALAFRAFGVSFMSARFVSAISYAITVVVTTTYVHACLKHHSAWVRYATIGLTAFMLTRVLLVSQVTTTLVTVTFLILYAHGSDTRARSPKNRTWSLVLAGFASGALLTMRLNVGIYLTASIGAGLLFADRPRPRGQACWNVLTFAAPVCGIALVYLLSYGSFASAVLDQIARSPNVILRAGHILDASRDLEVYGALLAISGLALASCRLDWRDSRERRNAMTIVGAVTVLALICLRVVSRVNLVLVPYIVPGVLTGALVASQALWKRFSHAGFVCLCFLSASTQYYLIRADSVHVLILSAAATVVAVIGIVGQPQWPRIAAMAGLLGLLLALPLPSTPTRIMTWLAPLNPRSVLAAVKVVAQRQSFLSLGDSGRVRTGTPLSEAEARFFAESDELATARYLDRAAAPNDSVFVGLTRHDRTRVNNARLSWLLPRPLASRYLELEPGIITSEPVQREVMATLSTGVQWVVQEETPESGVGRYPFSPSPLLDQYIWANYSCEVSFGRFRVCRRQGTDARRVGVDARSESPKAAGGG